MKTVVSSVAFQGPDGTIAANGRLLLSLSQNAMITSGGGQVYSTIPVVIDLDATGKIPAGTQIWANDELTPTGTTYLANLQDKFATRLDTLGSWSIAGASPIDVSQIAPSSSGISMPSAGPVLIVVPYSATPALTGPGGFCPVVTFQMTMTGNVSAPILSGIPTGAIVVLKLIEDAVGGRTFAYPSNIKGFQSLTTDPNTVNVQAGIFDGTNLIAIGPQTNT